MPVTIRGSGQVPVQIVTATSSTGVTNNTTTYTSTGLTANITPTNSSNKVLVTAVVPITYGSSSFITVGIRILRNSTVVYSSYIGNSVEQIDRQSTMNTIVFLDSPATTSSTTYTIEFATVGQNARFGNTVALDQSSATNTGSLVLQELSGT